MKRLASLIGKGIYCIMVCFFYLACFQFVLFGCGRQFIMSEDEINKLPELPKMGEYALVWAEFHPVLLMSEGIGANHALHLEDERVFSGIKVIGKDHMVRLMAIIPDASTVDFSKAKGIISSRSGKHFYSVDGKNVFSQTGYLAPKFEWSKVNSLAKSGIQIEKVQFNSERNKEIEEILIEIGKKLDKIPGLFDKIMSRVAKVTTQDIFLAGATNFTSLFAIFGVRAWAIVDAIIQKADLSLPYYDTALVDRFQLGLALEPIQKRINNLESGKEISPLIQEWGKEMEEYRGQKKKYKLDYQEWLKEKAKYEQ